MEVVERVVIRQSIGVAEDVSKVCNFLRMAVHRRRYLKIRSEIRRLEAESQVREQALRENQQQMQHDITYRSSLPNDTSTYRRR
jgi:hypothetical protein